MLRQEEEEEEEDPGTPEKMVAKNGMEILVVLSWGRH
jgi:hypothetical protein